MYQQYWTDSRLSFPPNWDQEYITLDASWKTKLWVPEIYFRNAIQGQTLNALATPLYFEINNDTVISMAARMTVKFACDMDLFYFPQDTQQCTIDLVSSK